MRDHDANSVGNDGLASHCVDDLPPDDRRGFQRDKHFRFGVERQRLILERSVPFGAVDRERATFGKRVDHKSPIGTRVNTTANQLAVLSPGVKNPHTGSEATRTQGDASVDAVAALEGHLQVGGFSGRPRVKRKLTGAKPFAVTPSS